MSSITSLDLPLMCTRSGYLNALFRWQQGSLSDLHVPTPAPFTLETLRACLCFINKPLLPNSRMLRACPVDQVIHAAAFLDSPCIIQYLHRLITHDNMATALLTLYDLYGANHHFLQVTLYQIFYHTRLLPTTLTNLLKARSNRHANLSRRIMTHLADITIDPHCDRPGMTTVCYLCNTRRSVTILRSIPINYLTTSHCCGLLVHTRCMKQLLHKCGTTQGGRAVCPRCSTNFVGGKMAPEDQQPYSASLRSIYWDDIIYI